MAESSVVGSLSLPVAAGTAGLALVDPVVEGLLHFVAWTLNDALNARLANYTGLTPSAVTCTAVPTGRAFAWDPTDPRSEQIRLEPPALFLWWDGESAAKSEVRSTICTYARQRTLRMLWLMPDLPIVDEMARRRGLYAAADAAMHRASYRQCNEAYAYTDAQSGTVYPLGMPISLCLAEQGYLEWEYVGGRYVRWGIGDQDAGGSAVAVETAQSWPCLAGLIRVWERVGEPLNVVPDDVNHAVTTQIAGTDGGYTDTVPMIDGWLTSPDGTEDEVD